MKMSDTKGSAIIELGPQYDRDSAFAARMRLHQSWYRAYVLGVPYGTGPGPRSKSCYGNMLRPEDGEKGLNFLSPEIFEVVQRRLSEGSGVEPFRVLHNMLSSQPMCFNLLGLLAEDLELATSLWRRVLPDEVMNVTKVRVEYAPEPAGEYLGDATAFDAFVEYSTVDGRNGFCGIETKLTEPFSQREYDRPEYWEWMKH